MTAIVRDSKGTTLCVWAGLALTRLPLIEDTSNIPEDVHPFLAHEGPCYEVSGYKEVIHPGDHRQCVLKMLYQAHKEESIYWGKGWSLCMTAAYVCAACGYLPLLRMIPLPRHAYDNVRNAHIAVCRGHADCLMYFVKHTPGLDTEKLLCQAVYSNRLECVKALVSHGVTSTDDLVASAVLSWNIVCVRYLMDAGYPVTGQAVRYVARCGDLAMLRVVLDSDVEFPVEALSDAVFSGSLECLVCLLAHSTYSVTDECMDIALRLGDIDKIVFLHRSGVDFSSTHLQIAATHCNITKVEYVLQNTHPNVIASSSFVVNRAAITGNIPLLCMLRRYGARVTPTTLRYAVRNGRTEVMKYLLDAGIVPPPHALCLAVGYNCGACVKMLVSRDDAVIDMDCLTQTAAGARARLCDREDVMAVVEAEAARNPQKTQRKCPGARDCVRETMVW